MIDNADSACCGDDPLTKTAMDPFLGRGAERRASLRGGGPGIFFLIAASARPEKEKTSPKQRLAATTRNPSFKIREPLIDILPF
jgi:hypothetical protein